MLVLWRLLHLFEKANGLSVNVCTRLKKKKSFQRFRAYSIVPFGERNVWVLILKCIWLSSSIYACQLLFTGNFVYRSTIFLIVHTLMITNWSQLWYLINPMSSQPLLPDNRHEKRVSCTRTKYFVSFNQLLINNRIFIFFFF